MAGEDHRTTGRILDALEVIAQQEAGMGLSEIARRIAMPKGSLYPLLATMVRRNYLYYNESTRRYHVGPGLFIVGRSYVNSNDLLDNVSQEVRNLACNVEETVYFAVLSGGDVLYLAMSDAFTKIKVISSAGRRLPAYSTACGKAILSQFSPAQIRQLYPDGLGKITENTVASFERLNQQLDQIRRTGFAFEEEESTQYIRCAGVPIQYRGKCLAGLSVAVPILRYNAEKEERIKSCLLEAKVVIEAIIERNIELWTYS